MSKPAASKAQAPSDQTRFNLANALTGLRLLLAPFMGWAIMQQFWLVASLSMILAIVTDVYDGKIARRQNRTSAFGGLFDHGTDAFFVSIGAWALAESTFINPWLWPCITLAFVQYALDSKVLAGHKLRTSLIGRYNGVGYYAIVATAVGAQTLQAGLYEITGHQSESLGAAVEAIILLHRAVYWAAWFLVATTLLSIADRLYHSLWRHAQKPMP
jgi:phosphatidylglycerophosphate synthase